MRDFEPTHVLRRDGFRTGCREARSGRISAEHRAAALLVGGARQSFGVAWKVSEGRVDNVHSLGFGLASTGAGSGRIPYVSAGAQ